MDLAVYETDVPFVVVADATSVGSEVIEQLEDVTCERVVSEAAAIDAIEDRTVDCVVVGSDLEDASGVDFVESVTERWADLPILYVPATGDVAEARAATTAGASEYLPLDLLEVGELSDRVTTAVDRFDEQRQVRRERNMFHELLSNTPLSVYWKNEDAEHIAVSSEATAYRDESLLGKTDYELYADEIGEEAAREAYEDDLRVIETGEPVVNKEERHVDQDGAVTWYRTTKVPWREEDGEIVGLIGITRTVTEVKERERELEQEKQRLEQFASFVSHDLRNPVNVAKGYLEEGIETGDRESLEEVMVSLERMERMIDDLLEMARFDPEEGETEWTDLRETVERTWESIGDESASLDIAVPPGTQLRSSPGGLRQILQNLFKNSIDHVGSDVTVEVGTTPTGFYVADDGPGIPAEDRDRVFEYGFTTDGTGVGLAIVKEIADAHRWETDVTAASDGGARFEFHRCILRPPETEERPPDERIELTEQTNVDGAVPAGNARRDGPGSWTIEGGGANVWAEVDEYYAAYTPIEGNFRATVRCEDLEGIHEYSKAGLFTATEPAPGSPLGFCGVTAGHGAETMWRTERGTGIGSRQYGHLDSFPIWLRFDRIDDRVTCYASLDGHEWEVIDQRAVDLPERVTVGLLVNSHNEQRLCAASFEDLRIVPIEVVDA